MCALSLDICVDMECFDDGGKMEICWKRSVIEPARVIEPTLRQRSEELPTTFFTAVKAVETETEHVLEKRKCMSCRVLCALSLEICVNMGCFNDGGKVKLCW